MNAELNRNPRRLASLLVFLGAVICAGPAQITAPRNTNNEASLRGLRLSSAFMVISSAIAVARSSVRLGQVFDQRFQILRRQRLEAGGHDGKLRGIQVGDVF